MVSVQSNDHVKLVNNDDDLSKIVHENIVEKIHERFNRTIGSSSTIVYDGSASITRKN